MNPDTDRESRLLVVSNRLPVTVTREGDTLRLKQGAGGLVTAMAPVLRDRGGVWIGWPGSSESGLGAVCREFSRQAGYLLQPVELDDDDVAGFYQGFSNEIIWPLFHEFLLPCRFVPSYWEAYARANAKFTQAVAGVVKPGDFLWVHDYHLMLMASQIRDLGIKNRMGFFLHIPFPPADIFLKLPWRRQVLDSLMSFDLLGFQTPRDRLNFAESVKRLHKDAKQRGRGQVVSLTAGGRQTRVGAFPISIDFKAFSEVALRPAAVEKSRKLREAFATEHIIFGAERLDYTKGLAERLDAFALLLETNPELHRRVSLVQIMAPSREDVPMYRELKATLERMVGEINGRFASPGWTPVHYISRGVPMEELILYYLAADICLVTSLRDGMNLVAKEYVACNVRRSGTLCLSEFAGAAMEFHRHATMINPFDIQGMATAIKEALTTPDKEKRRHMRAMRDHVRRFDIFHWVDAFLLASFSRRLGDFPTQGTELAQGCGQLMGPPWNLGETSIPEQ
ncbi:trehalose-6-phosphate synthase [Fundidesulfovibrio butyratiphilus]